MESRDIPQPRTTAKRPESTIAQNFAADLDSMFGLTPEVDGLTETVNQKKTSITTSHMELQELEARLRAMEDRLAKVSRNSSPARAPPPVPTMMRDEPQSMGGAQLPPQQQQQRTSPLAQRPTYPADRPPTAPSRRPPMPPDVQPSMPGQFPTHMQHNNMSNEYVMVESSGSERYR